MIPLLFALLMSTTIALQEPTVTIVASGTELRSEPIVDRMTGRFAVVGFRASATKAGTAVPVTVKSTVLSYKVIDRDSRAMYSVISGGDPYLDTAKGYCIPLQVTSGKFPLRNGKLAGWVTIRFTVTAGGDQSVQREKTYTCSIIN